MDRDPDPYLDLYLGPDCDTGKTWLGGGMHCPSASSLLCTSIREPV